MSDPLADLQAFMAEKTTMPGLLITILAFLIVVGVAHGFTSAAKYAVRERKRAILFALLGGFSLATYLWWSPGLGLLGFVALAAVAVRKPLARLFRRRRGGADRRDAP